MPNRGRWPMVALQKRKANLKRLQRLKDGQAAELRVFVGLGDTGSVDGGCVTVSSAHLPRLAISAVTNPQQPSWTLSKAIRPVQRSQEHRSRDTNHFLASEDIVAVLDRCSHPSLSKMKRSKDFLRVQQSTHFP